MKTKTTLLVLLLAPFAALAQTSPRPADEPIALEKFTVEDSRNYVPLSAGTASKTDTPVKEVPFAVSTVTLAVIEDQRSLMLGDLLRNVPGVTPQPDFGQLNSRYKIRGFVPTNQLKNGFRQQTFVPVTDLLNVAQVEVLKGPASALYGRFEPGGVVNIITKKPFETAFAQAALTVGSDEYYRGTVDLSGPVTANKSLLYRVNLVYEDTGSYRDFFKKRTIFAAPVVEWRFSPDTKITFEAEGGYRNAGFDRGFGVPATAALGQQLLLLPVNRNLGEPTDNTLYQGLVGFVTLDHKLNDAWKLHAGWMGSTAHVRDNFFTTGAPLMPTPTTYNRRMLYASDKKDDSTFMVEVAGKVTTGAITHKLLIGADTSYEYYLFTATRTPTNSPIDIFNPVYGQAIYAPVTLAFAGSSRYDSISGYAQDEIGFGEQWKLTLGGRYDSVNGSNFTVGPPDVLRTRRVAKFSPRGGLTYTPVKPVSFYASAGKSFNPEIGGVLLGGQMTLPSVGTEFEAGVKTEFMGGRLVATASRYDLKKTNVVVGDPANPGFSIQVGEQRSKGTELELQAVLAKGWNLVASYAHDEAKITKDTNAAIVGNRIVNVPKDTASLWSTYEISSGPLTGFKFGGGLFNVGARPVNNANLFFLPGYTRYDAMIGYRDRTWRAALNLQNLTDKKYFDSAGGVFHPMAPRQVFFNVTYTF